MINLPTKISKVVSKAHTKGKLEEIMKSDRVSDYTLITLINQHLQTDIWYFMRYVLDIEDRWER